MVFPEFFVADCFFDVDVAEVYRDWFVVAVLYHCLADVEVLDVSFLDTGELH